MSPLLDDWEVTLCDPIWHVSSCSSEACCELLYAVNLLYYFVEGAERGWADGACGEHCVASEWRAGVYSATSCAQLQRRRPGVRTTNSAATRQRQAAEHTGLYYEIFLSGYFRWNHAMLLASGRTSGHIYILHRLLSVPKGNLVTHIYLDNAITPGCVCVCISR